MFMVGASERCLWDVYFSIVLEKIYAVENS